MQVIKYMFQPHGDDRGQLVALEEFKDIPFKIKRVYYMYDTGEGVRRGYHAHKNLEQILADNSGKTVRQVHKDAERDYWMSAQETLEYGFIDEIMANNSLK